MTNTTNTTSTRPLLVAAAIPSALSLAWTAWSVADMVPAPWPIAVSAGIALDIALVAAVAIAWIAPAAARPAQGASWAIAVLAAAAIGVHAWSLTPALVLLAPVPLVAKTMWHLALTAKAAADAAAEAEQAHQHRAEQAQHERHRRLSTDLTEDEQAAVADLRRQAAYETARAAAQRELEAAQADAAHQAHLADLDRRAAEQMAADEATARIHVRRHELAQQIQMAAPVASAQQLVRVPDDASGLTPPQAPEAGFAGAFAAAGAPGPAQGAHRPDQHVPGVPTPAPAAGEDGLTEAERNRRAVLAAYRRLSAGGIAPSITDVAAAAGVSRRTVNRHRPS